MKTKFLIALCSALSLCLEVNADGEFEVKRGRFPYMAFLYYPDELVVDGTGARFLRGAILIRPDWLVTSAVGPSIITDAPNGFPRKTLLARLGAISIDANFTLNEDEDEQEREVIQIVRPFNHSATQWWRTDISLMKLLSAFNMTSAVGISNLYPKREFNDKTCIILVYAKRNDSDTEDRSLMQITVELLSPSIENCGSHFIGDTMTCASDSDENKNVVYSSNFCHGNSGGPLICENEVIGIQTYIDNDCKQPHLYQLLSSWENFVTCGTEDKCQEEHCSHICDVVNKDAPVTYKDAPITYNDAPVTYNDAPVTYKDASVTYKDTPVTYKDEPVTDTTLSSEETTAHSELAKVMSMESTTNEPQVTLTIPETTTEITTERSEETTTTATPPSVDVPTSTEPVSEAETAETRYWPNEKFPNVREKTDEGETEIMERKPKVEARLQIKKTRSAGPSNVSNIMSLFWILHFGVFDLMFISFYV